MKPIFSILFLVAVVIAWCSSSFAREAIPGGVPSPGQLSIDGSLNGVDLTGAVTLLVGTLGGPELDILTSNVGGPYVLASAVASLGANDSSIVDFNTTSQVFGDMGATTTHVLHNITLQGAAGTSVTFLGSVYATTMNVAANNTANFNGGNTSTNTVATNFTGDGTISLATNTLVTGALTTNTANTGTLSLGSGSQLTGAVGGASGIKSINVVGGSNTAGVSAKIVGAVDTNNFSLGTNTLNINGALTMANGGTGTAIATTLASPSIYGNIVVTGGVTSLGTGLAVDVTVPATSLIVAGNKFTIVNGSGTGALTIVVNDPTNPLYTFSIVTAPGGAIIQSTFVPLQIPLNPPGPVPAVAPLAVPVATVLVNATNPSSDLTTVLAAINALTTSAAVVNAEVQLSPLTPALVAPLVTFQGAREFQNLWLSRLDMCNQFSGYDKNDPSCQKNNPHSGWWAKGFGYFANQDDRGAFPGYDAIIAGTMIAYDVPIAPDTRAGLGVGYSRSEISGNTYRTSTDIDSYRPTVYIGQTQGPWFIDGSASFAWNQYTGTRHIMYPGTDRRANASYAGQDYTTFLNTGFHIPAPQQFKITPIVSLQYSRVNVNGYTEKGAGDIDLHVKPQGYDFLESGLGGKVERSFNFHNLTFVPDLSFKWLHDFLNPSMKETAQFMTPGVSAFTTPGLRTSNNTYDAGAGITLLSCGCGKYKWSLGANYDYFWRYDGYSAHQATVRFTLNF